MSAAPVFKKRHDESPNLKFGSTQDRKNFGRTRLLKQYFFPSLLILYLALAASAVRAAEKIRVAYPAVAPGSTPSWVTAEKGIWQKYGFDV